MLPICPHWFFIVRQQARSSILIAVVEATQAIAGARHDTSRRTSTPSCRKIRIVIIRLRPLRPIEQMALQHLSHAQGSRSERVPFQIFSRLNRPLQWVSKVQINQYSLPICTGSSGQKTANPISDGSSGPYSVTATRVKKPFEYRSSVFRWHSILDRAVG